MGSSKTHRCHTFEQKRVFLMFSYMVTLVKCIQYHTIYLSTTNNNYFKLLRTYKFSSCKSIFDFTCANDRLGICSSDFFKVFFFETNLSVISILLLF